MITIPKKGYSARVMRQLPGQGQKKVPGQDPAQRGGDRNRTGVQTYSTKAFYMFILELIVGR
jgi:hypothetical protein